MWPKLIANSSYKSFVQKFIPVIYKYDSVMDNLSNINFIFQSTFFNGQTDVVHEYEFVIFFLVVNTGIVSNSDKTVKYKLRIEYIF